MQTQYASATSDNLKLAATGTGDIAEMTESLADDEAAYAYVRMKLGNDEYSERVKFAFVVWAGMILPFPFSYTSLQSCLFLILIPHVLDIIFFALPIRRKRARVGC
tara:strand:- start:21408 stop:21725 length:318 start_codon:yes stop_codon:yes gene_type:complete